MVLPPSSRRKATIHRTVATDLSNLAYADLKEETHPDGWVSSLELLARFELAARLHEIHDFMEASRPRIEIDEVASSRSV